MFRLFTSVFSGARKQQTPPARIGVTPAEPDLLDDPIDDWEAGIAFGPAGSVPSSMLDTVP